MRKKLCDWHVYVPPAACRCHLIWDALILCRCLQSVNLTRSPLTQVKMFVQLKLSWTLQFSAFCFVFRGVLASPPTTTMTPRWRQSTWTRSWTSWPNAGWNRSAARWTARISTAPFRALSTRSSLEQYEKLAYTSCSQTRAQFAPFVSVRETLLVKSSRFGLRVPVVLQIFPRDLACMSTMMTFEYLSQLCQNKDQVCSLPAGLKDAQGNKRSF